MLRRHSLLGASAAVLSLLVGLLVGGCGGDSDPGAPAELWNKWVTKDQATGEDVILDLSSGSFSSMPRDQAAYALKKAAAPRASKADDDQWVSRCGTNGSQLFYSGYIMVGVRGKTSANSRTITVQVTDIHGDFWNSIWGFSINMMKCIFYEIYRQMFSQMPGFFDPSDLYYFVNSIYDEMYDMFHLNSKWYNKAELKAAFRSSMEDEEDFTFMEQAIDAMYAAQTMSYELSEAKDILKITGTDGTWTVYERVEVVIQ